MAKGLIGRSFIRYAENLVSRMPVVRSFYSGVKQIAETVLAQQERSFEKACMIEYPRKGIWAIGFVSTTAKGEIAERKAQRALWYQFLYQQLLTPHQGFYCFSKIRYCRVRHVH